MPQENVERLRSAFEVFNRTGEIDVGFFASDFEMQQASSIIDTAGTFYGQDALNDALKELGEAFDDLHFEMEDVRDAPGGELVALVRVQGRGRGSNMEIDNHIAHVWTFRDGLATRLVAYEEPSEALEAAGVSE